MWYKHLFRNKPRATVRDPTTHVSGVLATTSNKQVKLRTTTVKLLYFTIAIYCLFYYYSIEIVVPYRQFWDFARALFVSGASHWCTKGLISWTRTTTAVYFPGLATKRTENGRLLLENRILNFRSLHCVSNKLRSTAISGKPNPLSSITRLRTYCILLTQGEAFIWIQVSHPSLTYCTLSFGGKF